MFSSERGSLAARTPALIALHSGVRVSTICDDNKHIWRYKNLLARTTDFPHYIGEGYSIETILEAVLRFS
jgi:hypothetical protein